MSRPLTHREIEELLGAFALDAIEDDERDVVEAHLLGCPRCRAEVAGHRETAALLAHSGAPAPDGVWTRITETLDEVPPELDLTHISRRSISLRTAAATVAVAAALTAFFGVRLGRQDARLDQVSERVQDVLLRNGLRSAALAAMGDPAAEKLKLSSFDGQSTAQVVRLPAGNGFVVADNLPALSLDRTYQLWAVRSDAKISLGVLGSDPDVSAFQITGPLVGYAITEEVRDGVAASQNSPVVVGWLEPPEQPAAGRPADSA